tara:strand:+ start:379 stop:582 length:204 start_codon:yes stop_codon:yes gene_type:complete
MTKDLGNGLYLKQKGDFYYSPPVPPPPKFVFEIYKVKPKYDWDNGKRRRKYLVDQYDRRWLISDTGE